MRRHYFYFDSIGVATKYQIRQLSLNYDVKIRSTYDIKHGMRKHIKRPVELLSAAVLLVVCCGGKLYGMYPFGAPMFCALSGYVFIGFSAPIYILCSFLFTFDVRRLYLSGAVVFISATRWFLGLKFPRFDKFVAKTLFSIGAILTETVLLGAFGPITDAILSGFIGMVFYYFADKTAASVGVRFSFRPSVTEAVGYCVVAFVSGLAFGRASYGAYNIGLALCMFSVLLFGAASAKAALGGSVAVALGLAFESGGTVALAFVACAAVATAFRALPRPPCVIISIGAYAAFATLFSTDPVAVGWNALMLAVGGALFCMLPRRVPRRIRAYFDFDGSARIAVRHYINRIKSDAANRMLAVATVFDETARLINGISEPPPDFVALGRLLSDKICPYCKCCDACDKSAREKAFAAVAERAFAGKAIITDLPDFFSSTCVRTVDVIAAAAEITDAARERRRDEESESKAKAIVTERLAAVKDVLTELGESQAVPVGFDGDAEEKIAAELCLSGVECAQVFVTREWVTAIVRTGFATREKIARAVSVCLKREYAVATLEKSAAAGWSIATLKRRPAYEAVYARAGVAKSGVSGDSYTFERIDDRFLVALLDGMGTGESAGISSDAAVELIECFYKAGFDSKSALSGVNRFLKLPKTENYSAADVVVCDLDSAAVDIIKIGAPPCYIKTADTVLKVEGNSLPIGVLDEMRPFVTSKRLYPGQMLVLVTDGISDCFSGDELPEFINGLSAYNPEKAASAIVKRALDLDGGVAHDDMTAIAFRLFDAPKKRSRIVTLS